MKSVIALSVFVAFIFWYALWGRDWLQSKSWMQWYYGSAVGQWLEVKIFKNSRTILLARLKIVTGLLLTALTQIGTIDLTPVMPFVPDGWEGTLRAVFNLLPLTITLLGWADEKLRNETTEPIATIALTEAEKQKPEIAAAVAKLDEAKSEAVVAVAVAKAEATV